MRGQMKRTGDGEKWYNKYRLEFSALTIIVVMCVGIGWAVRSTPPETDDVLSALNAYAAFYSQDAHSLLPTLPTNMTLEEIAARTQHVQILDSRKTGDDWLVDAVLLATWSQSEFLHFKLQLKLRKKGATWIVVDARRL